MNQKELIKFLLKPEPYPYKVKSIKVKETYISYLLFAGPFVYKIKKNVNYGYLDFTTLEKRRHFCFEELRLNKRISKDIYLDVVPIIKIGKNIKIGKSSREGIPKKENILEYAVKMKRIPDKYWLPNLIGKKIIGKEIFSKLAKVLADFHNGAETSKEIEKYGKISVIERNTEENFSQTKKFVSGIINPYLYEFIKKSTRKFLKENKKLFEKRIKEVKIRDCHGDFHTQNIFFKKDKIYVIDCIEFNKRFRYQDVVSDAAFLSMDLDFLSRKDLSEFFVKKYIEKTGDKDITSLLPFYKSYRAYVRAKISCFSLEKYSQKGDLLPQKQRNLFDEIQKYIALCFKYTLDFSETKPFLIILCGIIGSGKSYLADYISKIAGIPVLNSDVLRKEIFKISIFDHKKGKEKNIYSEKAKMLIYKELIKRAAKILKSGSPVIIDATFSKEIYRDIVIKILDGKFPYFFVECKIPEKMILERLKQRNKEKAASDADISVYFKQKKEFERFKLPKENYLKVDRTKKVEVNADKVLRKVVGRSNS